MNKQIEEKADEIIKEKNIEENYITKCVIAGICPKDGLPLKSLKFMGLVLVKNHCVCGWIYEPDCSYLEG